MQKQKVITARKRSGLLIAVTAVAGVFVAATAVYAFIATGFTAYNVSLMGLAVLGEAFLIYRSITGIKVEIPVEQVNNPTENVPPAAQSEQVEDKNLVLNG